MKFVKISSCEKRATTVMKSTSTGGYGILGIDEYIYTETGTLLKGKPCIIIDELLATPLQSAGCFMYIWLSPFFQEKMRQTFHHRLSTVTGYQIITSFLA